MALYYPGCSTTIQDPVCSDCPDKELGDIRSLALVKEGFTFTDITDQSEWNTGIVAGDIYIIPYTRGGLEVAPNETEGYGDVESEIEGYAYTLTAMEPNLNDVNFWNTIKDRKDFRVVYRTETKVWEATENASIAPTIPITSGDKKSRVVINVVFKWSQEDMIVPYANPTGIFEQCLDF